MGVLVFPTFILFTRFMMLLLLLLLLLLLFADFPSIAFAYSIPPWGATPKDQAESLIRSLNLHDNIIEKVVQQAQSLGKEQEQNGSRIVEWKLPLQVYQDMASPGLISTEELGAHAGYFQLNVSRMFYFFFESRGNKRTDPLLLWMTGGPGCGSELALFYENGPFHISQDLHLHWNEYGWDKVANMIFVDQPIGTGFSYASHAQEIRQDEEGISQDMYDFIQAFFESHPDYRRNDFFLTGESYAGHYIPSLASYINKANKEHLGPKTNLKGFAIGNGLTHPVIQYETYPDYALAMGLIEKRDYDRLVKRYPICEQSVGMCENEGGVMCMAAYLACNRIYDGVISLLGNTNYYDIRKQSEGSLCYDFSLIERYLNQRSVQVALGVEEDNEWVACSSMVYEAMMMDWMRNDEAEIPNLLEDGIMMLIYAGEFDLVCNWLGNSRWVEAMEWSGKQHYIQTALSNFTVNGKLGGEGRSYGPVTFLKVYNAGHMMPMDQPEFGLEMIWRWTRGFNLMDHPNTGTLSTGTTIFFRKQM